jgi:hypothetical protein
VAGLLRAATHDQFRKAKPMTTIKSRDEELALATAHYMRTAKELYRAHDRNTTHQDHEGFDAAAKADHAAAERLDAVLAMFPKEEAARLWGDIIAARKKL